MKNLAEKYWEQVIDDYTSCMGEDVKVSKKLKKKIVDHILNDDFLWENIDETIGYWIVKEAKKNETKKNY